jgi:hypothetical protein
LSNCELQALTFISLTNYCPEVATYGPNTIPIISKKKGRKSGGGLKPEVWAPAMSAAIFLRCYK